MNKKDFIGKTAELAIHTKILEDSTQDIIRIAGWANRAIDQNGDIVVDRDNEVVLPKAYNLDNYMKNPVILYQHNKTLPIGKAISVDVRPEGLYIEAEIHRQLDEKAFYGVKSGVVSTFSIGFLVKDVEFIEDVALFTDVELLEVSAVSVPSSQESIFSILTDAPCQSGVCLLGNKAVSKETIVRHNKSLKTKEWSSINKLDLKESLKDKDENIIKDAYLVVKDVNNSETWKFPHHDFIEGVLVTNIGGIKSAFSALKSIKDDDILSRDEKLVAAKHLKSHFEELFNEGLVEEALLQSVVELIDSLDNTETKDTEEMKIFKDESTETPEEVDNTDTEDEGTETPSEQFIEDNTINTLESIEEDANGTQDPVKGESNNTSDNIEVGVQEVERFINTAKSSEEGLNQLFVIYSNIEDALNEALEQRNKE